MNTARTALADQLDAATAQVQQGMDRMVVEAGYAPGSTREDPWLLALLVDAVPNISASMRYALRQYGSLPKAYDRAGGYDDGGYLQPGTTLAVNASGKPEPVFTADQWAVLRANAAPDAGQATPSTLVVLDVDGALVGRTRIEAGAELAAMADDAYYRGA